MITLMTLHLKTFLHMFSEYNGVESHAPLLQYQEVEERDL